MRARVLILLCSPISLGAVSTPKLRHPLVQSSRYCLKTISTARTWVTFDVTSNVAVVAYIVSAFLSSVLFGWLSSAKLSTLSDMSTINIVKYFFHKEFAGDSEMQRKLVALAYQTARSQKLYPKWIFIRYFYDNACVRLMQ